MPKHPWRDFPLPYFSTFSRGNVYIIDHAPFWIEYFSAFKQKEKGGGGMHVVISFFFLFDCSASIRYCKGGLQRYKYRNHPYKIYDEPSLNLVVVGD